MRTAQRSRGRTPAAQEQRPVNVRRRWMPIMLVRSISPASAVMISTIFWRSEVTIARGWSRKLMPIQSSC
eukprot:9705133-Heterocapsa_arctica.AAC.1